MKTRYLIVYDYGTGGVWGVMWARSKPEILDKYPELAIVDERPAWMSDADFANIVRCSSFDIDDPPKSWLAVGR